MNAPAPGTNPTRDAAAQTVESRTGMAQSPSPSPLTSETRTPPPQAACDVLGDVLESVHLKGVIHGPLTFDPPWAVQIDGGAMRLYVLTQGRCLLTLDHWRSPVDLACGDLVLVAQGQRHRLGDSLDSPVVAFEQALTRSPLAGSWRPRQRPDFTAVLVVSLPADSPRLRSPLSWLPPFICIKGENANPPSCLADVLRVIMQEASSARPGAQAIINRLCHVLLVQTLRTHIAAMAASRENTLPALLDPDIGQALRLIHHQPGRPWTVASLASEVGMSRSAFAARFHSLVGQPPLHYLLRYRMKQACQFLRDPQRGIKDIAARVGYSSEAAFSCAFKRWTGVAPGSYRLTCRRG
jgi:AraC-like DNA-binding protein